MGWHGKGDAERECEDIHSMATSIKVLGGSTGYFCQ